MMHCNNVVVTLVDDNKTPLREHEPKKLGSSPVHRKLGINTGRSCKVLMPFETEFKVLIKNKNNCRVMIDITIDGAKVSGNGLILDAGETDYIERSVEVANKFKFVTSDHEDVADPDNEDNGNIIVTVWKEQHVNQHVNQPVFLTAIPYHPPTRHWNQMTGDAFTSVSFTSSVSDSSQVQRKSLSPLRSMAPVPQGEAGAVIDGEHSDQSFGTTHWNGKDGAATKFVFYVRGVDKAKVTAEEFAEYARLKQKIETA